MFTHTRKLITLAGVTLLVGCGDTELPTAFSPEETRMELEAVISSSAETLVPVKWTYHMAPAGTDFLVCPNSDGSPPMMAISRVYVGEGSMSHLGRLNPEETHAEFESCLVNLIGGLPVSAVGSAIVELVGANGDAVFLEGELTLHFAQGNATGEWDITGGTGRFEGAGGWMDTWETPTDDGSSLGKGEGMITPPGVLLR